MSRSAFSLSIICFASTQAVFFGQSQEPPFNMGLILLHFIGRDLIVANDHAGDLHVLRNRQSDFALRRVAAFHGLPKPPDMDCEKGCGLLGHDRRVVAYLTSPKRLTVACRNSDIVILPFATAKYPCAAMLIDETFLQRDTPMQIIARGRHLHIKKAANGRLWQK